MRYLAIVCLLLIVPIIYAHQPRMIDDDITIVPDPQISKAYYAELQGAEQVYVFTIDRPFSLYASLLVPDTGDAQFDFSVIITRGVEGREEIVAQKHGLDADWFFFYEPFAKDEYWNMPVFGEAHGGIMMQPGEYAIRVLSPDNKGKYILAIGDVESFPPGELVKTWMSLPQMKQFMGKSPYTAYFNMIGGPFLVLIVLLGYMIYKHR